MPECRTNIALGFLASIYGIPVVTGEALPERSTPQLEICFQHGCARHAIILLDPPTLAKLAQTFARATADPRREREAIAAAIAQLEDVTGSRLGTSRDLGGTFPGAFQQGQMDCLDEATNTTRYLQLFAQQGWLHWHTILAPVTRLPILRSWWPHTSAAIRERISGETFAVDSWFEDNGQPPHIVDLTLWRRGWSPPRKQP